MVRAGYSRDPVPAWALATFGYGDGSTFASCVTGGFSTYTGAPIVAPAGKQYVVVAGLPWSGLSILQDPNPSSDAAQAGDLIICDTVSTPNSYPITMNPDGTFTVDTQTDTSRQSFQVDVSRVSVRKLNGMFTIWVNNLPPIQTGGINYPTLVIGLASVPLDLASFVTDAQGDALTFAVSPRMSEGLPPGMQLAGSVLSGTPSAAVTRTVFFRVTDVPGDYTDIGPLVFNVQIPAPALIGLSSQAATAALAAAGLTMGSQSYVLDPSVTGTVLTQSVAAGSPLAAGSSIDVTLSSGTVRSSKVPTIYLQSVTETSVTIGWDTPAGTYFVYLDGQRVPGYPFSASPVIIGGLTHPRRYRISVTTQLADGSESAMSNEITFSTEDRTLYFETDHSKTDPRLAVTWRWK